MSFRQSRKRKWLPVFFLGVIIFGGIILAAYALMGHPPFQRYLLTQIAAGSGYTLQADDFGIRYEEGVEVWAAELNVTGRASKSRLSAVKTEIVFDLKALLKGQLAPLRLEMDKPQIYIAATAPSSTPAPSGDTERPPPAKWIPWESMVSRIPAEIRLTDAAVNLDSSAYQLKDTDITIKTDPDNPDLRDLAITGQITSPSGDAALTVNGRLSPRGQTDDKKIGAFHIALEQLPLAHLPRSKMLHFQNGRASLEADLALTASGIDIPNGVVKITSPEFILQKRARKKSYALEQAQLTFDAHVTPTAVTLNGVTSGTPQTTVLSSFHYDWAHRDGPQMEVSVSTEPLPMERFKALFPGIIIPKWIISGIFPMFTDGKVRLDKFALQGPLAAIQRMRLKENEDCLRLDVRLIDTVAFQERPGPVVNHVSGRIQIKEGALIISEVSGKTETSNLTRSGYTIPDLYEYPARHRITLAGDFDLADLRAWHAQPVLPKILRNQLASFSTFTGRANGGATITLKGPRATGLTGDITLTDSVIERDGTLWPIKIDTGRIQMPPDRAAAITAQGQWGKNILTLTGSMDLNHLLLGVPRRFDDTAELAAQWDLAGLNQLVTKNGIGPGWLTAFKQADGVVRSSLTLRQTAQEKGWQYGGGAFEWEKVDLAHAFFKRPVSTKKGSLHLSGDGAGQYAVNGRWGESSFDLSGRFDDFFHSWSTQGTSHLSTQDLAVVLTGTKSPAISADKPVPVDLAIEQTEGNWSINTDIALDGQKLTIGHFTFSPPAKGNRLNSRIVRKKGSPVEIEKLQWQHQKKHLDVQGTVAPNGGQPTRLTLSAKDFPLDQLGLSYKEKSNRLVGTLTGEIDAAITENRLDTVSVNGPLRIQATKRPVADRPLLVSGWDVDVVFDGTRITVQPSTLPLSTGERMHISGELAGWEKISGGLRVTLDTVYLDRWIQRLQAVNKQRTPDLKPVASKPAPWVVTPDLAITLSTPAVLWNDRSLGQFNASLRWIGYDGHIDAADLEAPDINVTMSGRYGWPLSDRAGLSLRTYIHLMDINSDRLLSGMGVKKNDIHGTLNLEGGLETEGRTTRELAQTASGRFKLGLKNGFIREPNVLIKVLEFISLENIFIKKPPDTMKDQFYYKNIDADFVLEDGIVATENFFMKSPVFNMGATGKLDMSTMDLNLLLAAQPLNTLDAIVSRIPIAGHILTGKNRSLLVYTFEVDGTLDQPKVHQKPFKNLDKAVAGYFQRIFLTPARVISKVGNYLKDILDQIETTQSNPPNGGGEH